MAIVAVGFNSVLGSVAFASQNINLRGYWLNMQRVNAIMNTAQMVVIKPFRDWPNKQLVSKPMAHNANASVFNAGIVPILVSPNLKLPTWRSIENLPKFNIGKDANQNAHVRSGSLGLGHLKVLLLNESAAAGHTAKLPVASPDSRLKNFQLAVTMAAGKCYFGFGHWASCKGLRWAAYGLQTPWRPAYYNM